MLFLTFFFCAIATILLARKLSTYANIIEKKSTLTGAFVAILLGGASSLPEITTSVTAVSISNPDLAVGNILGSNLFNILILATMDITFRKHQLLDYSTKENVYTTMLGILLSLIVALSLFLKIPYSILGIGLDTIILIIFFFVGIKFVSKYSVKNQREQTKNGFQIPTNIRLKEAVYGFLITAIFLVIIGSLMTISADRIASLTGWGSTFVGSYLLAASTSLPEAVSVIMMIKLKNYPLAIGSILGSNIFNLMILAGTDIFYRDGLLIYDASNVHLYAILGSTILMLICLYALIRKKSFNSFTYIILSILIVILYFIFSYVIFVNSAS